MYYVYVLWSEKDGKLYIGSTPDLKKRISKHNMGYVLATKNRLPIKLIHYEAFFDKEDALKRKRYLKGGKGHDEMKIFLERTFSKIKYFYR